MMSKTRINSLKTKAKSYNEELKFEVLNIETLSLYEAFQKEQSILKRFNMNRIYRRWSTELFDIDIDI